MTATVKVFQYGGCAGNSNNFLHRGECLRKCTPEPNQQSGDGRADERVGTLPRREEGSKEHSAIDVCSLPEHRGSCFHLSLRAVQI